VTKFLIDECLSPKLAEIARTRGHYEASHVTWIGKAGWQDWDLMRVVLDEDWVLVTRNSDDFRGPSDSPGSKGQYAGVTLHAGLICINGPPDVDRALQSSLFDFVLNEVDGNANLINQVLEITYRAADAIEVIRYKLPRDD